MKRFWEKKDYYCHFFQQIGWFNTSFFILGRFLNKITRNKLRIYKYYLVVQPVHKTSLLPSHRGKNIKVKLANKNDSIVAQFPRPHAVIQKRFENGAKCFVAYKEGEEKFLGFIWILLSSYQEDEVRAHFMLSSVLDSAWDFDVYVTPNNRMGIVYVRLWDEANLFLLENNRYRTYSRISAVNRNSLKAHSALGAESIGSLYFFCINKLQITFATIPPYFHLSFCEDSIPQFNIE